MTNDSLVAGQMIMRPYDLPVSHLPGKMPPSGATEATSHSCVDEDSVMSDTTAFRMVGLCFGSSFVHSPANCTICTHKHTQCHNFPVGEEFITNHTSAGHKFCLVTIFIRRMQFFHVSEDLKCILAKIRTNWTLLHRTRHQRTLILHKQFAYSVMYPTCPNHQKLLPLTIEAKKWLGSS